MNTGKPLPPPFQVGVTVRYLGSRKWLRTTDDGKSHISCEPGIVVQIIEVNQGRQGTGQLAMEDDNGYKIYDETQNGYSVYDAGKGGQWIIWPEDESDWEVVQ